MRKILDKSTLKNFSKMAATRFSENKTPIADTVSEIAKDEHLIPAQIRYVTQEANKEAWANTYKTNKDEAYGFSPADPESIIDNLQVSQDGDVVKEIDFDYMSTPDRNSSLDIDTGVEKAASSPVRSKREIERDILRKMEKLGTLRQELLIKELENNTQVENETIKIAKILKNELLSHGDFATRSDEFKKFAAVAFSIETSDRMAGHVGKIKNALESNEVMMKTAGLEAPEQYISKNLPARVINGNSEVYLRIKTLLEYDDKAHEAYARRSLVDETLPRLREAIREL